ncbi:hypothetical protein NAS141_02781 [Sulfitobacter sp. NAS-14.1]|nr:hypothetical protein NAS141_02781 [Sulfitobacter sp. NAS-14.1]
MRSADIPAPGKAQDILVMQVMQTQIGIFGVIPAHIGIADKSVATGF